VGLDRLIRLTQMLFVTTVLSLTYPALQIHMFGFVQIALIHLFSHFGIHLLPLRSVISFSYPDLHVHVFGDVQSPFTHASTQVGAHILLELANLA
jgi:hypothetical protein